MSSLMGFWTSLGQSKSRVWHFFKM